MTELVHHPRHYNQHWWFGSLECMDLIRGWEFRRASAFKYVFRMWGKGDPDTDLDKAIFFLEDILVNDNHYGNRLSWWLKKYTITDKRFAKEIATQTDDLDEIREIELKALLRMYWGDIPGAHQSLLDLRAALVGEPDEEA